MIFQNYWKYIKWQKMWIIFKKDEIWVVKGVLTNVFWCKKPDMMTFAVCLHLSWSECLFISTDLWSLLMSRVIISVLNIDYENLGLLYIKLKSYFFYQVKSCRFQLDQRRVCKNVFRNIKTPWMLFWKYLQVLMEVKTDIEKVHDQAIIICGKFDNSST